MGNRFKDGGYEKEDNYKNASVFFLEIDNIHFVRENYEKMFNIIYQD